MNPTTTRVPALLDALVARFTSAVPTGTLVTDGPLGATTHSGPLLLIGVGDGTPVVSGTQSRQQGMGVRRQEDFNVVCLASETDGSTDMKAPRDRVAALLAAVEAALTDDPHLGGVVDFAELGDDFDWFQAQTAAGAVCEVAFTVRGRALL